LRRPSDFMGKLRRVGNVAFDTVGRQLYIDDEPKIVSAREMALLELLLARAGRVVPKAYVENQLFGHSREVQSNAIEVYVHRLRKQLADFGATIEIHTVRGVGYLLTEQKP
jgi:DNA-binding response OmpR family regulator